MSLQCGKLWPTNGWDQFTSLGHPSKFQPVSHFAFITAATSLTGGQPNFARCLAVSWAGTLCIHFLGLLPRWNFARCKNSRYIQVLHSRILAALLQSTPSTRFIQTLRRGTRRQRAPPIFGWVDITLGISPHSSWQWFFFSYFGIIHTWHQEEGWNGNSYQEFTVQPRDRTVIVLTMFC